MRVVIFACSKKAYQLQKKLEKRWKEEQPDSIIFCKVKCKSLPEISEKKSMSECTEEYFSQTDAFVFISATGIAVRSIAPFLQHKSTDPAVVVLDEQGMFCISLLSGHAGGANELTKQIAEWTGAIPVITTATDREGVFAVDEFARKNGLTVTDWNMAKQISVEILEGKQVGMYSDLPWKEELPKELYWYLGELEKKPPKETVIIISYRKISRAFLENTLYLVPKVIVVGMGCRKGTAKEKIEAAIKQCLWEEEILIEAVSTVASIDLKKDEAGICAYCKERNLPFVTFSAEKLQTVEGEFSASSFVEKVTGVSCVCERSAVLAAGGELLCRKKVYDGVTVALAVKNCYLEKGKITI